VPQQPDRFVAAIPELYAALNPPNRWGGRTLTFDKLGVGIVPLWRSMQATEVKGDVYSQQMIDAIVNAK
jgi:hypothetical protein